MKMCNKKEEVGDIPRPPNKSIESAIDIPSLMNKYFSGYSYAVYDYGHGVVMNKHLNKARKTAEYAILTICLECEYNPHVGYLYGHDECGIENCPIRKLIECGGYGNV